MRGDYSHPFRAYTRLRRWYWALPRDRRAEYNKQKVTADVTTVLLIVMSGIAGWAIESPIPFLGVFFAVVISIVWIRRIRTRFGFPG